MDFIKIFSTGGIVGATLSHYWTKRRDKGTDLKKLEREISGLLHLISFSLLMQYSELYNLKKDLQKRLDILKSPTRMQTRDGIITVVQNFSLDSSIIIKFEHIGNLLNLVTTRFSDYQINPSILQSCHISNKNYLKMISVLQQYCDMKKSIDSKENLPNVLIDFLNINMPEYLRMVETYIQFIYKTQESLTELFTLVDKKPFQVSGSIKLWD
ncbi:hypothetical protein [Legionella sp. WA2022007384]